MKTSKMSKFKVALLAAAPVVVAIGLTSTSNAVPATPGGVSSGLVLWLDASDPAGTGTAPANGTSVVTWVDKSGVGNHATVNPNGQQQANTAATFETSPTGFNGKPALLFTRIDDNSGSAYKIAGLDIRASVNPDITVFTVYRPTTLSQFNAVWGDDDGNWDRFFQTFNPTVGDNTNDGLVGLGPSLGGETIPDAGSNSQPNMLAISYDGNVVNGDNSGPQNGSYVYFDCSLRRQFTDSTHASNAKDHLSIGWDGDGSTFDGYIAEVVVYNRVLTAQEVADVNSYLAFKYSLNNGCASFATTTTSTTTTTTEAPTTTATPASVVSAAPTEPAVTTTALTANALPTTGSRDSAAWITGLVCLVTGLFVVRMRRGPRLS